MPRQTPRSIWFAAALGLMGLAALPGLTFAADALPAPDPNAPWMSRSQAILEDAMNAPSPEWVEPKVTERQRRWAREIMEKTQTTLREGKGKGVVAAREMFPDVPWPNGQGGAVGPGKPDVIETDPDATRVFLTLGDGQAGRKRFVDQLQALVGMENVEVVLRGLPPDMRRIGELMRLLAEITRTIEGAPPVLLDPKRFTQEGVEGAPTVVFYRDGESLARITGSLEIGYLESRIEDGQRGNLGARGPVYPIAEQDLMSVIRKRWAAIDWEAQKQQAIEDYWNAYTPTTLPPATKPRMTTINPSIVVARTIRAPNGQVIAREGQHINPLALVPFTGAIIAFDGGSPEQVRLAKKLADKVRADGLRAILMTQGLPGEKAGFDALERLQRQLGERVYLLDARVISRFDLQALPAVVRSAGSVFRVREVPAEKISLVVQERNTGEIK